MQMQLLVRSSGSLPSAAALPSSFPRFLINKDSATHLPLHNRLNRFRSLSQYPTLSSSSFLGFGTGISASPSLKKKPVTITNASIPVPPAFPNPDEETERAKLAQVFFFVLHSGGFHLIGRWSISVIGFVFFFFSLFWAWERSKLLYYVFYWHGLHELEQTLLWHIVMDIWNKQLLDVDVGLNCFLVVECLFALKYLETAIIDCCDTWNKIWLDVGVGLNCF